MTREKYLTTLCANSLENLNVSHDVIFITHDKRKISHDVISVTHDNRKISHDVMHKFSREFCNKTVR